MSRVLIIEDDPMDLEIIMRVVSGHYEATHARTLSDAIQQLTHHTPDAIILDVGLPDSRDSAHAISEIKKHRKHSALVVVSGCSDPERIAAGLEENADGWVVKGSSMAKGILHEIERGIANFRRCCKIEEGISHLSK